MSVSNDNYYYDGSEITNYSDILNSTIKTPINNSTDINNSQIVANRLGMIIITLSWYIYGKYAFLSLKGLIKHRNFNFTFAFLAAIFAFANNTNDLAAFIYHPQKCRLFYDVFRASATLNWAPISWLQCYRLAIISKIYLSKRSFFLITFITVTLSTVYCTFYFLNLSLFDYEYAELGGCAVTNPGKWIKKVMISDIADSVFSLATLSIIILNSIKSFSEVNTRNKKLNDLVGQGILQLVIIAISKIVIYPIIDKTSSYPALDVFWDILSVIVIISAYKLVNFPYEYSDNDDGNHIRKNIVKFIDNSTGNNYITSESSRNDKSNPYYKSPIHYFNNISSNNSINTSNNTNSNLNNLSNNSIGNKSYSNQTFSNSQNYLDSIKRSYSFKDGNGSPNQNQMDKTINYNSINNNNEMFQHSNSFGTLYNPYNGNIFNNNDNNNDNDIINMNINRNNMNSNNSKKFLKEPKAYIQIS